MSERIRPPYRPDDDIPFNSPGLKVAGIVIVGVAILVILVAGIWFVATIFGQFDGFLFLLITPLLLLGIPMFLIILRYLIYRSK